MNFLHDVEGTVQHLLGNGIPAFGGLNWLVQHLLTLGEDPITFINTLVSHIEGRGGDVNALMEAFTVGVMELGIEGLANKKKQELVRPIINTLNLHNLTGQQLVTLHQNTITTVHNKLNSLTTGDGTTSLPLQGAITPAIQGDQVQIHTTNTTPTQNETVEPGNPIYDPAFRGKISQLPALNDPNWATPTGQPVVPPAAPTPPSLQPKPEPVPTPVPTPTPTN